MLICLIAPLQRQTHIVELLSPESWPFVWWLKAAAVCCEFCRTGSVHGRELIIVQLVCTGAEQEGTKRNRQENEAWESVGGGLGGGGGEEGCQAPGWGGCLALPCCVPGGDLLSPAQELGVCVRPKNWAAEPSGTRMGPVWTL